MVRLTINWYRDTRLGRKLGIPTFPKLVFSFVQQSIMQIIGKTFSRKLFVSTNSDPVFSLNFVSQIINGNCSRTPSYTGCANMNFLRQLRQGIRKLSSDRQIYNGSQKVPPSLKLFAIFSLLVNTCNWKLYQLLTKHIATSTPILVHLSEYLCEMYHFYWWDPQILRIQFSLLRNSWIFHKNTSYIKWHLIKYNN